MKRIGVDTLILWSLALGTVMAACTPGVGAIAEPILVRAATLSDALQQDAETMAKEEKIEPFRHL